MGLHVTYGGIFRDYNGALLGGFFSNLRHYSGFDCKLQGLILAIELDARHGWTCLWIEGGSNSALLALKISLIVPYRFCNRWHNIFHLELYMISSHIFREDNGCTDKLRVILFKTLFGGKPFPVSLGVISLGTVSIDLIFIFP